MRDELTREVIGAAIEVHMHLGGPGLLESVYEWALCNELELRGVRTQSQVSVPIHYKGTALAGSLVMDLLIEDRLIVEVKAVEREHAIHRAQLLTYLRLTGLELGLILNFGRERIKDGVQRVVNSRRVAESAEIF